MSWEWSVSRIADMGRICSLMVPPLSKHGCTCNEPGDKLVHIAHKSRGLAPNDLRRFHASLTRNPTPSQQRQLCTSDFFASISDQARSRIRPSSVVDDADAPEQVYLCTRY